MARTICTDRRLAALQLSHNLVQLTALHEVALRGVRIDFGAVILILFARALHVLQLRLLVLVKFRHGCLRVAPQRFDTHHKVVQRRLKLLAQ